MLARMLRVHQPERTYDGPANQGHDDRRPCKIAHEVQRKSTPSGIVRHVILLNDQEHTVQTSRDGDAHATPVQPAHRDRRDGVATSGQALGWNPQRQRDLTRCRLNDPDIAGAGA